MSVAALQALIAGAALAGIVVVALAGLWAWHEWLAFRRQTLARGGDARPEPASPAAARIDLADLRERVRRLEAIAAGVDF